MKNIKNTLAAIGLAMVMAFGAISANAELLKGNQIKDTAKVQCTVKSEGFLKGLAGFINGLTGITIFDVTTPVCT
ncbi:MAG: hypothetical protein ACR2MG_17370 [Pyrinomonadaceae bacterium]